jgi:serpin B
LTGEPGPPLAPAAALAAQSRLAIGLVSRIARVDAAADNIVVSPASLAAVLSLLDLGAEERMRRALHRTVGFDRRAARNAAADLDGLRGSVSKLAATREGPLSIANAIVFDPASAPYRLAVMGLRATGAEVRVEDLGKPETLRRINEWVAAQTKGLIPSILDEPPRDAGLVALNALYFKDRWRKPFDPRATASAPFALADGGTVEVPMMRQDGRFSFRQDERFVAVDLDYASDGFGLVIVTTKDKPARPAELAAAASWLGGDAFKQSSGELALPRFSLEGKRELLAALDALGLRRARRSPTALSGLSPTPQVITRVVQKTVLRVDEAGTEAAAATAVTTTRALQTDFVKMTVDKPFLLALRERSTGLILLAGYVGRPAAAAATH